MAARVAAIHLKMSIMTIEDGPTRSFRPGAVVGGLVLLALGAGLLVDRTGVPQLHHLTAPIVLIVLGAVMSLEQCGIVQTVAVRDDQGNERFQTRRRRGFGSGGWLIWIGIWMLISQNHLWGFTFQTSWPLFIVGMGAMIVLRGWR
jgi:hypothetical protein